MSGSDFIGRSDEALAWLAQRRESIQKIRESNVTALIYEYGDTPDPQQALELGAILLMGKPLILVVMAGSKVPDGLARAADAIIEWRDDANVLAGLIRDAMAKIEEQR